MLEHYYLRTCWLIIYVTIQNGYESTVMFLNMFSKGYCEHQHDFNIKDKT
jgi:hypothetical protein